MRFKYVVAMGFCFGGFVIIPGLFWLSGFDFNTRGGLAVMCAILALCSIGPAVAAATYPDK